MFITGAKLVLTNIYHSCAGIGISNFTLQNVIILLTCKSKVAIQWIQTILVHVHSWLVD